MQPKKFGFCRMTAAVSVSICSRIAQRFARPSILVVSINSIFKFCVYERHRPRCRHPRRCHRSQPQQPPQAQAPKSIASARASVTSGVTDLSGASGTRREITPPTRSSTRTICRRSHYSSGVARNVSSVHSLSLRAGVCRYCLPVFAAQLSRAPRTRGPRMAPRSEARVSCSSQRSHEHVRRTVRTRCRPSGDGDEGHAVEQRVQRCMVFTSVTVPVE